MLVHKEPSAELFREICRARGWRCTAQRRAVFSFLCGNRRHPSVETIWHNVKESLPDVSLDSVYRILDAFAEAGLVQKLEGGRSIRYDADTKPHDHFLCVKCGALFDFAFLKAENVAEACRGFGQVEQVELTVRGVCNDCRQKENQNS